MNLTALFPPTLVRRVVEDLGAIADAARRLTELERELLQRADRIQEGLAGIEISVRDLPAVRQATEPLPRQLEALRAGMETVNAQLQALEQLRAGIEPLDEDMRAVRHSVDDLEPLLREVNSRIGELRNDLGPLGQLAEKIPGVGS
jgi:chromosome segregation ATPase